MSSVRTAAQQVMVVSLVPQDSVVSALALHSATHNLTKVVGPSVGGVLLTFVGAGYCLIIPRLHPSFHAGCALYDASAYGQHDSRYQYAPVEGYRRRRFLFPQKPTHLVYDFMTYSNGFFGISLCSVSSLLRSRGAARGPRRLRLACFGTRGRCGTGQFLPFDTHPLLGECAGYSLAPV